MNDDRVRDLMKGFGDPIVPAPDERNVREARARAIPRIEASLRAVAASNARRTRTRRVALLVGIAAALVIGVASATVLSGAVKSLPAPSPASTIGSAVLSRERAAIAIARRSPTVDPPAEAPAIAAPEVEPVPVAAPNRSARASEARPAKPAEASTLSDQNRLLAAALEARKRSDDARALGYLNELLRKYPASPLAPEAEVERRRCLDRLGKRGGASGP